MLDVLAYRAKSQQFTLAEMDLSPRNLLYEQDESFDLLNISNSCFTGDVKYAVDLVTPHQLSFLKGHLWVFSL